MKIENGDQVTLKCTAKLTNDQTIISDQDGPLSFKVGEFDVLKGLNTAVIGMAEGDTKQLSLNPEEAFGSFDENLLTAYPLQDLPENTEVGAQFNEDGSEKVWTVRDIDKDKGIAVMDGNHILAGQTINLDIEVTGLEKA